MASFSRADVGSDSDSDAGGPALDAPVDHEALAETYGFAHLYGVAPAPLGAAAWDDEHDVQLIGGILKKASAKAVDRHKIGTAANAYVYAIALNYAARRDANENQPELIRTNAIGPLKTSIRVYEDTRKDANAPLPTFTAQRLYTFYDDNRGYHAVKTETYKNSTDNINTPPTVDRAADKTVEIAEMATYFPENMRIIAWGTKSSETPVTVTVPGNLRGDRKKNKKLDQLTVYVDGNGPVFTWYKTLDTAESSLPPPRRTYIREKKLKRPPRPKK